MKIDWKMALAHGIGVAAVAALVVLHYLSPTYGVPMIAAILGISIPSPVVRPSVDPDQTVKP